MEGRVLFLEALQCLLEVLQLVCALGCQRHTHDRLRYLDAGHGQADTAVCESIARGTLDAKQRNDVASRLRKKAARASHNTQSKAGRQDARWAQHIHSSMQGWQWQVTLITAPM